MIEKINTYEINVVICVLSIFGLTFLTMSSPGLKTGGHGGFVNLIAPSFIGILVLAIHFVVRKFKTNRRWIITVIGLLVNFYYSYQIYLNNF